MRLAVAFASVLQNFLTQLVYCLYIIELDNGSITVVLKWQIIIFEQSHIFSPYMEVEFENGGGGS